jgi:tRNA (Thr-GGU) A37 N-methylase
VSATDEQHVRAHEVSTETPLPADATLAFIGHSETPGTRREACPRQGTDDEPECTIVVASPWDRALDGVEAFPSL